MTGKICVTACIAWCFLWTETTRGETIEEFLRGFHANPARMMDRLPSEVDASGNAVSRGFIDERAISERIGLRSRLEPFSNDGVILDGNDDAGPDPGHGSDADSPDRIVEPGGLISNIQEMHDRGLTAYTLSVTPWTDSYWPIAKGLTANRFADPSYPNSKTWDVNYLHVQNRPPSWMVSVGDVNRLSPAEKYDFIMGDYNYSLSEFSWRKGKFYWDTYGDVPSWMGICHGWAAAAHMTMPYPDGAITVRAANGTPVKLFIQDVKALNSMIWAYASPRARFAGSRCNVSRPPRSANGRILPSECYDVSPRTWHLAVTNQMGVHKRSFVLDATYDYEVWNYPLVSYKYRYFNPQTWQESANPAPSTIPIGRFTVDKFREFRNPNAKSVIGVFMDISFVKEVAPSARSTDAKPPVKTLRLIYDLELDENRNVIGGEWYQNAHPDFLWTFGKESQAKSKEDRGLAGIPWSKFEPVPPAFTEAARRASSKGVPLWSFLSRLVPDLPESPEPPTEPPADPPR